MEKVDQDVFNRHIYQDEIINIKAKDAVNGDVLIIQQRAYEIYRIVPISGGFRMFAFRQGVMLQCMDESTQQKYISK